MVQPKMKCGKLCIHRKNELKSGVYTCILSLVRNMRFPENSPCPKTQNRMFSSSRRVKIMVCGLDHSGSQPFNYIPMYCPLYLSIYAVHIVASTIYCPLPIPLSLGALTMWRMVTMARLPCCVCCVVRCCVLTLTVAGKTWRESQDTSHSELEDSHNMLRRMLANQLMTVCLYNNQLSCLSSWYMAST